MDGHSPRRAWYQRRRCPLSHRSSSLRREKNKIRLLSSRKCKEYSGGIPLILNNCSAVVTSFLQVCVNRWVNKLLSLLVKKEQPHKFPCRSYRESSQEPSSRGFPPQCTSSCDRVSSGRTVYPATTSLRACLPPWAETARSLPPPLCCPARRKWNMSLNVVVMLQAHMLQIQRERESDGRD